MAGTVKIVVEVEPEIKEMLDELAFKAKKSKKETIIGLIVEEYCSKISG